MSRHLSHIEWTPNAAPFTYETFDRSHDIAFPGGQTLKASSAVEYKGDPARVNPEELLVAAASNCHMLTFLSIAARKRLIVTRYVDDAVGYLEAGEDKRFSVTRIELRPVVEFEGEVPTPEALEKLHDSAHRNCFIANSIRASVTVMPTDPSVG
jgi:organic hydroperoxide reductase OsmC/OhrA